jgi:hypothetical protein
MGSPALVLDCDNTFLGPPVIRSLGRFASPESESGRAPRDHTPGSPRSPETVLLSSAMKPRPRLLLLLWLASLLPAAAGTARAPNVILIMADDFGYECVTANGGQSYQTPHLDRLAATGMRFERCHVQPLCTPTRVQLMTGLSMSGTTSNSACSTPRPRPSPTC